MIHNLKALSLALAVAFAMSAMVVSAAFAASFTAPSATTTITANQTIPHIMTVTGVGITCTTVSFHGVSGGTNVSSVTIKPTYTGCTTDTLGLTMKITGFGHYGEEKTCHYVLHASGTVDLVCQAGAEVRRTWGTCSDRIPAQKGLGAITYENGASDINASINITNISGTHTDGFGCPYASSGSFNNGTMSGLSTVHGSSEGKTVAIAWDK